MLVYQRVLYTTFRCFFSPARIRGSTGGWWGFVEPESMSARCWVEQYTNCSMSYTQISCPAARWHRCCSSWKRRDILTEPWSLGSAGSAGLRMSVRWLHQARTFHAFLIAWHQRSILGQGGRCQCMSNITWVLWPVWKECAEYSPGNARPDLNGKICEPCDLLGLADSFQSSKNSVWRFGFPHLYAQRISEPCCTGVIFQLITWYYLFSRNRKLGPFVAAQFVGKCDLARLSCPLWLVQSPWEMHLPLLPGGENWRKVVGTASPEPSAEPASKARLAGSEDGSMGYVWLQCRFFLRKPL